MEACFLCSQCSLYLEFSTVAQMQICLLGYLSATDASASDHGQIHHNCSFLKIFDSLLLRMSLVPKWLQQLQNVWVSEVTFHFSALALEYLDLLSTWNSPCYWRIGSKIDTLRFCVDTKKLSQNWHIQHFLRGTKLCDPSGDKREIF